MKTLSFLFFLIISFYSYSQDSIKVAGYGSMADIPTMSGENESFAQYEFSHFSKDTQLEVSIWTFEVKNQSPSKEVIVKEDLLADKNARIDIFVENSKNKFFINSMYYGNHFLKYSLKSKSVLLPYNFKAKPKVNNKIVPIILFVDKKANVSPELIRKKISS